MSTPAHTALSVQQFLTKNSMIPVPHPPIHKISAGVSFFLLFPRMKNVLKGKCFAEVEGVKQNTAEALKGFESLSTTTVLSRGKNASKGVLHKMESTMEVNKV